VKIGNLEIRWAGAVDIAQDGVDRSSVFAVPDTDPFWLAVHQVVNEIERETLEAARSRVGNTNQCISAVGASEGAMMVRLRLIEKRENALSEVSHRLGGAYGSERGQRSEVRS
jgi:hypothetical protein